VETVYTFFRLASYWAYDDPCITLKEKRRRRLGTCATDRDMIEDDMIMEKINWSHQMKSSKYYQHTTRRHTRITRHMPVGTEQVTDWLNWRRGFIVPFYVLARECSIILLLIGCAWFNFSNLLTLTTVRDKSTQVTTLIEFKTVPRTHLVSE